MRFNGVIAVGQPEAKDARGIQDRRQKIHLIKWDLATPFV
jgi:hypothetical protein